MPDCPPLASIYYNPVGGCNLHCKPCWVDPDFEKPGKDAFEQRDRREDELTPEQFFRVLDDARKLGLGRVKFTGGEPFLRCDTIEMMEGAAERKLRLTVETNGTLLDDETVARLAKIKPNMVAVSVDSVEPDYHDRFRGVKGAHAKALEAIGKLAAAGCRVQIIAAITRDNVSEAEDIIRLGRELNVQSAKLCPVTPVGRGAAIHEAESGLSAREFLELYRRCGNPTGPGLLVHVEVPAAFRPLSKLKAMSLCGIKSLLGLLPNGDVSYCGIGMSHPELVMGNVLRDNLALLWREHPLLTTIREGLPKRLEGVCSRCTMKGLCLGMCNVQTYVLTGNMLAGYRFCEDAKDAGMFPPTRLLVPPTAERVALE